MSDDIAVDVSGWQCIMNRKVCVVKQQRLFFLRILCRNSPGGTEEDSVSRICVALETRKLSLPEHVLQV